MIADYRLATLATGDGERAAIELDGRFYRLDRLAPGLPAVGLRVLLDDWSHTLAVLDDRIAAADSALLDVAFVDSPEVLSPILFPNKLVCVGAVYRDHLEQFGLPPDRWPSMPIFLRPPTTSVVGPGRTVRIPPTTRQFDWEIELAVVIGKRLTAATEVEAQAGIAGYSIGIDFSCRDLLDRDSPVGVDLVRAKAQDCMAPVGPVMALARAVGDPQDLGLRLWVNGELRQDGRTSTMLFSVYEQVATISRFVTLEPGDIVFTGSPAGSARSDDQFLKSGDRITAEIDRIGTLKLELYEAPAVAGGYTGP